MANPQGSAAVAAAAAELCGKVGSSLSVGMGEQHPQNDKVSRSWALVWVSAASEQRCQFCFPGLGPRWPCQLSSSGLCMSVLVADSWGWSC